MTDDEMLDQLAAEGDNAGSDYNDSEKILGWFGWDIAGDVLTITYEDGSCDENGDIKQVAQWRLVKI
jgi:hypothetical protein